MKVTLDLQHEQLLKEKLAGSGFQRPEDLVHAALDAFLGSEFPAGELDRLISQAREDILAGRVLEGDEALEIRRRMRQAKRPA